MSVTNALEMFRFLRIVMLAVALTVIVAACSNSAAPTTPPTPLPTAISTVTPLPTLSPTPATPTSTVVPPTLTRVPASPTATRISPTPSPTPIGELTSESNAAWAQFVASIEADEPEDAQARIDDFWELVTMYDRVPLILNDGAIFLYKGDAARVVWRGDFSYWQFGTGLEGKRIGSTDLWYAVADFPRDSRAEYKIAVDDGELFLDPANPHRRRGGLGENSVLTMPDFQVTDLTAPRPDVPHGTLTDWIALESKVLGAPVNYRIYFPPNYADVQSVPVLYVTDGNDFSDPQLGAMQNVVDNLIADEKIEPLLVVFIDARDPRNLEDNQREAQFLARSDAFAEFLVTELVKQIDATHRTRTDRDSRGLAGTSYGGVFTTYADLRYPAVFGKLAIFSPAYWVFETPDATGSAAFAAGVRRMNELVQKELAAQAATTTKIFMSNGIRTWDVGNLATWVTALRARGEMVQLFQVQEGHSWGNWSGLTDELLEYLYPR